jgi:hypothetical protein
MTDDDSLAPAGWYPDPDQVDTQRYWDGEGWTDQRAPLAKAGAVAWSPRLVIGLIGGALVVVSCFLPKVESSSVLHVAGDTFMSNGDGVIFLVLGLAAGLAAWKSPVDRPSGRMAAIGAILIALAIYQGSSEQTAVVNGLGEQVDSSAGPAVWTLGLGGLLILVAGIVRPSQAGPA